MDQARNNMAISVLNNIRTLIRPSVGPVKLCVFDNGSKYLDHLEHISPGTILIKSKINHGLWSAIHWMLWNTQIAGPNKPEYIYIIESDLIHSEFEAIKDCTEFLKDQPTASSVRTQEFSVMHRWRYDKRLSWLPFHNWRSHVSMENLVTRQKAWFRNVDAKGDVYLSNLHPKLPGLHRVDTLKRVFNKLDKRKAFSEWDFFSEMVSNHPNIGVLDGGIFHSLTNFEESGDVLTGSWSTEADLEVAGYLNTRQASILKYGYDQVNVSNL